MKREFLSSSHSWDYANLTESVSNAGGVIPFIDGIYNAGLCDGELLVPSYDSGLQKGFKNGMLITTIAFAAITTTVFTVKHFLDKKKQKEININIAIAEDEDNTIENGEVIYGYRDQNINI